MGKLYRLLEGGGRPDVRGRQGRWLELMKASIGRLGYRFDMKRAVIEHASASPPSHTSVGRPSG
jgi:hypothetical protein